MLKVPLFNLPIRPQRVSRSPPPAHAMNVVAVGEDKETHVSIHVHSPVQFSYVRVLYLVLNEGPHAMA